MFFQELSISKMKWNDPLPSSLFRRRNVLVEGLGPDDQMTLQRWLMDDIAMSYRLVGFGDASCELIPQWYIYECKWRKTAYYYLLCSKIRVSSVEGLSIPRLELLSALILSRIVTQVTEAKKSVLTLEPLICYLDSKVTYHWISGQDHSWKPFVQNRVVEFRRKVPISSWKHCPGHLNPTDSPSRGQSMVEFRANTLWFSGPKVTFESADCDTTNMPEECLKEMKGVSKSSKTNEGCDQRRVHVIPPINTECVLIASESIGTEEVQGI